jgi:hypothetical protein
MSLWGTSTADRSKPKFLKSAGRFSPDNCYATAEGWTYRHKDGSEELLVAITGLSTSLGGAQISEVYFDKSVYAAGDTASVTVVFTEDVTNTSGTPTLTVTTVSGLAGSPITFTYASGSGTNKLVFTATLSNAAIAGEVLALAGQTVSGSTWADSAGGSDTVDTAFLTGDIVSPTGGTYANPIVSGATIIAAGFGAASYTHTDTVVVHVKYNTSVTVTGVPTLSINQTTVGAGSATYTSGSGTNTLAFSLDLSAGSFGVSGKSIQILAQTLGVTSASITDALGVAADLTIASGDRKDSALTGAYADIVLS